MSLKTSERRKQLIQEAWLRGRLGWKLHAAQRIIDAKLRGIQGQLFVGNCSRQWGKSFWAVTKAISHCIQQPRSRVKYGTAFHSDLLEFIIPTFESVLLDCPKEMRPVYKVQGSKWVFQNGSEIKLVGLDKNPNSLRGNVIDMIILDEVGFVTNLDYLYQSIIIPATTHRPNCKIIMISTPPQTPAHPFAQFIARAAQENAYIKLDIYTNPLINQATIDRLARELGGFHSIAFRRECLCELVIDTTLAILPEWPEKSNQVVTPVRTDHPPFYKPEVAIDLGLNDDCGIVFGYWDFKRAKVVVEGELLLNGVNSNELTKKCLEMEQRLWGEMVPMRWADGSLYTINDICSIHHYSVSPVKKDILEAQVNSLRLLIQSGQIEIAESCTRLIHQCATGIWDKSKTKFARAGSSHQDLLAALIYFVRHLNKENPFPRDYQYNRDQMHWRPDQQFSQQQAVWKKAFGSKIRG
jgi:hypothetical protein